MINRNEIEKLMKPFNYKSMNQKSALELFQAALLVRALDDGTTIIEADREKPDILLQLRDNKQVGLEITKIRKKPDNLIRQSIFDSARKEFKKNNANTRGFFSFYPTKSFPLNPNRKQRQRIVEQSAKYLRIVLDKELNNNPKFFDTISFKVLEEENKKPDFLERILFTKASKLRFFYNEGAFSQNPFTEAKLLKEKIIEAINNKEKKIENYIQNTQTEHQWLLIVNDDVSSESYDTELFKGSITIETKFERIFLLTTFSAEIIAIK